MVLNWPGTATRNRTAQDRVCRHEAFHNSVDPGQIHSSKNAEKWTQPEGRQRELGATTRHVLALLQGASTHFTRVGRASGGTSRPQTRPGAHGWLMFHLGWLDVNRSVSARVVWNSARACGHAARLPARWLLLDLHVVPYCRGSTALHGQKRPRRELQVSRHFIGVFHTQLHGPHGWQGRRGRGLRVFQEDGLIMVQSHILKGVACKRPSKSTTWGRPSASTTRAQQRTGGRGGGCR